MKKMNDRLAYLLMVAFVCVAAGGCSHNVTPVTDPNSASTPVITINGFEDGGSVEKNNQTGETTINADYGMGVTISGSAKDPGGVLNFSITVIRNGLPVFNVLTSSERDMNGNVPDQLSILGTNNSGSTGNTPMKFIMDAATEVKVSATNYAGKVQSFTLHYIPVAASQRGKNVTQSVSLVKNSQLNIFEATFPTFTANGTLMFLNGGPDDVYLLNPTGGLPFNCNGSNATTRLPALGNLSQGDYTRLFGVEHPPLPLNLRACALGPAANRDHVDIQVTYRLN